MALWLHEVRLDLTEDESRLPEFCADLLGMDVNRLLDFRIVRRAFDARRKSRIVRVYTVEFRVADEKQLLHDQQGNPHLVQAPDPVKTDPVRLRTAHRVLVVGMGPCGLFAAHRLATAGAQVTLIERGSPVEQRVRHVEHFWQTGQLDENSNVQFGEGGAGTFSDGKLTTRINHPLLRHILESFVAFGAPESLLVDARPHIGTDRLREVLIRFRHSLQALGVDLRFETCLSALQLHRGRVVGGICNRGEVLPCESLVLAPGHSSRDTYRMLDQLGVCLEPKGFAMGVRVEHPAELINRIQYGRRPAPVLPTADYTLRYHDPDIDRGVYSFCMCPGGEVINASSEQDGLVINGMSRSARGGERSNSALVVAVSPDDWERRGGPLDGMLFQQHWERKAFQAGGRGFLAPAQNLMSFLRLGSGGLTSSCRPGVAEAELDQVLPARVVSGLRRALPQFDRKMRGFMSNEAVLVGVETRTSAPLRIMRDVGGESTSHAGLFPAGEGAGYAGGIMSSALDGINIADRIIRKASNGSVL
jgi:uncharacterized FAD-dependent dehydrogenase